MPLLDRLAVTREGPDARRRGAQARGAIALVLAAILLAIGLHQILAGSSTASPPASGAAGGVPTPYPSVAGNDLTITASIGADAQLVDPHAAVMLPDGHIAVADMGGARVVLLGSDGRVLRSIGSAGSVKLQQPIDVLSQDNSLYVLDCQRGAIYRYDSSGQYLSTVIQNPALVTSRGFASAPDGTFYVANPESNSVVAIAPDGALDAARLIQTPLSSAPGQFNQPSAVAVGADGTLYVVDNQNNRIEAFGPTGVYLAQWPAPASTTLESVRILPQSQGTFLATDPAGAILSYSRTSSVIQRHTLHQTGQVQTALEVMDATMTPQGSLLITDGAVKRLLLAAPLTG